MYAINLPCHQARQWVGNSHGSIEISCRFWWFTSCHLGRIFDLFWSSVEV